MGELSVPPAVAMVNCAFGGPSTLIAMGVAPTGKLAPPVPEKAKSAGSDEIRTMQPMFEQVKVTGFVAAATAAVSAAPPEPTAAASRTRRADMRRCSWRAVGGRFLGAVVFFAVFAILAMYAPMR